MSELNTGTKPNRYALATRATLEAIAAERDELKLRNSYLEQLEASITEDVKKAAFKSFENERGQVLLAHIEVSEAENKKLREALEEIATNDGSESTEDLKEIAKEALE